MPAPNDLPPFEPSPGYSFPPPPPTPPPPPPPPLPPGSAPRDRRPEPPLDPDPYIPGPPGPFAIWFGNLGLSGMFMLFGSLTAIVNWFILYPAILLPAYAYLMVIAIVCTLIVLEATWVLFQKPPSPNKTVWLIVTMSITGVMTLLALYWFFDTIKYFVFPYFLNLLACGVMTAGVIIKAINEGLFGSGGGGGRRRYRDDDYDDRDDRDYDRRDNRRERDVDDRRDDRRGRDYDDRDDRDSREGRRRDRY